MDSKRLFFSRLAALLLDVLIVLVLLGISHSLLDGHPPTSHPIWSEEGGMVVEEAAQDTQRSLLITVCTLLVFMLGEGLFGVTPGMLFTNLRVGESATKRAGRKALLRRYLVKNSWLLVNLAALLLSINGLMLLANGMGLILFAGWFMALSPKKQALHDRLSRTFVDTKKQLR